MHQPETRPVYLSPHLDDVALSCGGLIRQQAKHGSRPLVITCFAGEPDYQELSPFAAELHKSWGHTSNPVALRRCEDITALTYLGAEYQHWNYLDCIYRRRSGSGEFLYSSTIAIFGELQSEEHYLIDELAARLVATLSVEGTLIYAPLAVGHHVDHQLVLLAALQLRCQGFAVRLYEDYPYAEDSENLAKALQPWVFPPSPRIQTLSEEELEAKTTAICFYRSQLDILFGGEPFVAPRVKLYALGIGDGHSYGERYWAGGTKKG